MSMGLFYRYAGLLLIGIAAGYGTYSYFKRFMEWLRFQSLGTRDYIVERLAMMFIEVPPGKVLGGMFGVSFGVFSIIFLALLPNLLPGLLLGLICGMGAWFLPRPFVDYLYRRRTEKLVFQMIDGLNLMSNGLKSGLSVVQSLGLITQEMPDPIRQEFGLVLSENKVGVSLEDAFNNFAKRVPADDVQMFVTSVNILKETGGNLAETFDTIVNTLRERIKVEKKIQAMVASGHTQGMILLCIPPGMAVMLYQTDPEMMQPLFTTPIGWAILGGVVALMAAGYIVITKIVAIDV